VTVTLEQVAKRYGRRQPWVLSGVEVQLVENTVTFLSGANGSGKTTLLRIVAGVTLPTAGAVRGRPGRVALVPDRFVAPARMTARAYLVHHGRIRGLTAPATRRRADELGERLGVSPGLDEPIQDLSKGNAQKIALVQAFIAPVELMVLDEPRTALDSRAAAVFGELLGSAVAAGTMVVISEPTPGQGHPGARRYELVGGRLQPLETPTTVTREPVMIRLRPRSEIGAAAASESFEALAQRTTFDGSVLTLSVISDHCDEVLRRALADGWSVLDVRRDRTAGPA
jgi:ABC-2 type transport system ATP-binding protein